MTIDECFCFFEQGLHQYFDDGGVIDGVALPHTQKNPKKPKGIGCEMKTLADSMTKILMHLEIVRKKNEHPNQKFAENSDATIDGKVAKAPWHCAVTLRACENWFHTGRTIIADSAFSSVLTAFWLFVAGLYFIGIVKQCCKFYPVDLVTSAFSRMTDAARKGAHIVYTSAKKMIPGDDTSVNMMAVGWSSSSKMKVLKKIISTTSTTHEGTPHMKRGIQEIDHNGVTAKKCIKIPIDRPKVVQQLFDSFSAIDVHDHYRQGILHFEDRWPTKDWRRRFLATWLGMILTDAFLAYVFDCKNAGQDTMPITVFCSKIAKNLIFMDQITMRERPPTARQELQVHHSYYIPLIPLYYNYWNCIGNRCLCAYKNQLSCIIY